MTRLLEPSSRDTAAPASTGPIPLSDAQLDQVSGGGPTQLLSTVRFEVAHFVIPSDPIIPSDPVQPQIGHHISTAAKGTST
jgi:hypothetical protein